MKTGAYNYKYGDELYWIGPWEYTNWTYNMATGVWRPNPGLGDELLTNGGFTTDLSSWDLTPGAGGGSIAWNAGTIKFTQGAGSNHMYASQDVVSIAGIWYRLTVNNLTAEQYNSVRMFLGTSQNGSQIATAGTAGFTAPKTIIGRSTGATLWATIDDAQGIAKVSNWDNVSLKAITAAHTMALRNFGRQVAFAANLTMTTSLPGGVVTRYSDANNYVLAWHDGTNIHLDKVVAGTATALINTAVAYVAGAKIEVRFSAANTAQLWYNNVQRGADQDVSTVPAGNWAGLFGTDSTVQLTSLSWS